MFKIKHLYLFLLLCKFDHILSKYITRETIYGKVRGFVTKRASNISVEQYLGIPYASPPVGNLRFEYPKVPDSWNNILDTKTIPPACSQRDLTYIHLHVPGFNETSEDCLYINVYVPQIHINTSFPVLLYVHGGSNILGMGAMFDGDVLAATGNIIIVTFNYRLGFLGFAANEDKGLEGAYGLMDQRMAMEWVKNNIQYFGGNPDLVTIHGHSAGAIDVGLHLVSPLSKGLFRQAIVHSQSPLSIIAMTSAKLNPQYNINNIDRLCPNTENRSLKKCLKSVTVERLLSQYGMQSSVLAVNFPVTLDKTFLKIRPEHLFEEGNFNGRSFLLSFTNAEWVGSVYNVWKNYKRDCSKEFGKRDLKAIASHFQDYCIVEDLIRQRYNLTNCADKEASIRQLGQAESDFIFVAPIVRMADMMVKWTNDLYMMRFDEKIHWDKFPADIGTVHGRDLFYIFGTPFVGHENFNFTEKDKEISRNMMILYSNFVKYGFLTLDGKTKYKKYSADSKIVNNIKFDNSGLVVEELPHYQEEKMKLWNEYPNEGKGSSSCNLGSNLVYSSYSKDLLIYMILCIYVLVFLQ